MRDLRHAIRFLWHHKSFTAAAVLTLAIGLGANTAFYGLLNAASRPLALPPERIVAIAAETKGDETGGFQYRSRRAAEGPSGTGRSRSATSSGSCCASAAWSPTAGPRSSGSPPSATTTSPALGVTPALGTLLHRTVRLARPRRARSHVLDEDVRRRSDVIGTPCGSTARPAVVIGVVPAFVPRHALRRRDRRLHHPRRLRRAVPGRPAAGCTTTARRGRFRCSRG